MYRKNVISILINQFLSKLFPNYHNNLNIPFKIPIEKVLVIYEKKCSHETVINLIHKLEFEMGIKFFGDLLPPNCHY